MASIIESLGSLISSIFGSILSIFEAFIGVVQSTFNELLHIINIAFVTVGKAISELAQTSEGLVKFLLSNIMVIGALLAGVFVYSVYQQRSSQSVSTTKKTN